MPFVYSFDHKHRRPPMQLKDLLGGKGANLAEMTSVLGLPVPPGRRFRSVTTIRTTTPVAVTETTRMPPSPSVGADTNCANCSASRTGSGIGTFRTRDVELAPVSLEPWTCRASAVRTPCCRLARTRARS